uniref:TIR domain-containing protein n=1 Tax=Heterorhabditis bacteriophora TaxID=37862 RepID=A0A1I7WM01_HETBA
MENSSRVRNGTDRALLSPLYMIYTTRSSQQLLQRVEERCKKSLVSILPDHDDISFEVKEIARADCFMLFVLIL